MNVPSTRSIPRLLFLPFLLPCLLQIRFSTHFAAGSAWKMLQRTSSGPCRDIRPKPSPSSGQMTGLGSHCFHVARDTWTKQKWCFRRLGEETAADTLKPRCVTAGGRGGGGGKEKECFVKSAGIFAFWCNLKQDKWKSKTSVQKSRAPVG